MKEAEEMAPTQQLLWEEQGSLSLFKYLICKY